MAKACLGIKSKNKEIKTNQRNNILLVEAFQFTKFHENEAKHDKRNFKRGLTKAFKVKNV